MAAKKPEAAKLYPPAKQFGLRLEYPKWWYGQKQQQYSKNSCKPMDYALGWWFVQSIELDDP